LALGSGRALSNTLSDIVALLIFGFGRHCGNLYLVDEVGYLPIDKLGADLLFQIVSERYERGSVLLNTNRAFKHWPEIFNHDAVLTSALLDRLLHHADVCLIEGKSFRAKNQIDT
jgi:DNA replication protein DnaC